MDMTRWIGGPLLLLILAPAPVSAQVPVTIMVPLSLTDVHPDIASVTLACELGLFDASNTFTRAAGLAQSTPVPVVGGKLASSGKLSFPSVDPGQANGYQCGVVYCTQTGTCDRPHSGHPQLPFRLKEGHPVLPALLDKMGRMIERERTGIQGKITW